MKKVFDDMGVAKDLKVGLAIYLFDGEADHWWESVKRMGGGGGGGGHRCTYLGGVRPNLPGQVLFGISQR